MILSIDQIKDILTQSQEVPQWVQESRVYNQELEALVNGTKFDSLLYKIEHKEDDKQIQARKRYSRSIKDMFERVLRPLDNIYTATGGSKKYLDEANADKIISILSGIRDNKSLEKWLQRNWLKLYHTDPNGVILYEHNKEKFYTTYKNISSIRNYESDGQQLEWILFEPVGKEKGVLEWRLIDDSKDYLIIQQSSSDSKDCHKFLFHFILMK